MQCYMKGDLLPARNYLLEEEPLAVQAAPTRWSRECSRNQKKKKKKAEALKVIKINEFKNCFKQWKKVSIGVLHQMENTLKVTEV